MSSVTPKPLFQLGHVVHTPGVSDFDLQELLSALFRHQFCDLENMTAEDATSKRDDIESGSRIFSEFVSRSGIKFWIITESDRSATTILLPSEY